MCEFCIKHGEGKKWYEVMENYSREMLADEDRQRYIRDFIPHIQHSAGKTIARLEWAKTKLPGTAYRFIRKIGTAGMKKRHFGQVVPLEDAEQIVDLVSSITRIACVCRSVTTGKKDARYCLLLGIDPTGLINDYGDLHASLETITHAEAKALLRKFDQDGLVHSVWTFKTPFIGALCNCDHNCLAYRVQVSSDLMDIMFKSEYVAAIDLGQCTGCRNCQRLCQFGAVEYSATNKKCIVNAYKCYGCGVCRSSCKKGAVGLVQKPELS